MSDRTTPRRATPEEIRTWVRPPGRPVTINWAPQADGGWWLVHELPPEAPTDEVARGWERVRRSTKRWADRHGMRRETRRVDYGRKVWVRFVKDPQ